MTDNYFSEDIQDMINQLIEHFIDGKSKPSWFENKDALRWFQDEVGPYDGDVISALDVDAELECLTDDYKNISDIEKINIVRAEFDDLESMTSHYILINRVEHSDGRSVFLRIELYEGPGDNPVFVPEAYTSRDEIIVDTILNYREGTTKPDGNPLSDAEILKLWDKVVMEDER